MSTRSNKSDTSSTTYPPEKKACTVMLDLYLQSPATITERIALIQLTTPSNKGGSTTKKTKKTPKKDH
ncbi:hypothetical protein G7Z17_g1726 [Cylindrodendrum hubeiense]|uniref:Uncharacterized protein n=1 Tax=Cylindrodendrum hubeiense TaxID=595255 RepID=A0A9P5HIY3_9HYPO|nr:hypothetical protein G7Z17_g1726 [Cylindrodendrum hubeiense]